MSAQKINVALIGLGRMGQIHFRHLRQSIPGVSVVAVADVLYSKEAFNKEYESIFFTNDPLEAIRHPDVDAVVICTPTSSHAELVDQAIAADKDIFCEKPLDLSLKITGTLLKKAKAAGTKLMLGFNRRFDPEFMQLKKTVKDGKIGKLQVIKITNRDPGIPPVEFIKHSGGMFMDFSVHDFDMAPYIIDKKVTEVFTRGLVFMDEAVGTVGDIDTALITLTFEDGTYAVIDNSRKAVYGYDQRIEVFGDGGMIQVENNLYNRNVVYDEQGIHQALPLNTFTERYTGSYLKEMALFIEGLLTNGEMPVRHEDMEAATVIAYAAKKSLEEQRPVKLTEIER